MRRWGSNFSGQLGDGTRTDRSAPVAVAGIATAKTVSAGSNHTCVTLADGSVRCWGMNATGQLGDGTRIDRLQPVAGVSGATVVAAGGFGIGGVDAAGHRCARLADGTAKGWGGQLLRPDRGQPRVAGRVPRPGPLTAAGQGMEPESGAPGAGAALPPTG